MYFSWYIKSEQRIFRSYANNEADAWIDAFLLYKKEKGFALVLLDHQTKLPLKALTDVLNDLPKLRTFVCDHRLKEMENERT